MAWILNANPSGYLVPPGGYPLRLHVSTFLLAEGVIPPNVSAVTVTAATEAGTADLHAAIYAMPTAVGGADGAAVDTADITGLGIAAQSLSISMPMLEDSATPKPYVFRVWADNISNTTADEIDHNSISANYNPRVPVGISITAITLS